MILQGANFLFNTDAIASIRVTRERDKAVDNPVRYTVYLMGHSQGVDVAGKDVGPFHEWLKKQGVKIDPDLLPSSAEKSAPAERLEKAAG